MSLRKKFRTLDGIFLLDKPSAITSNAALQQVKRLFNAAKAGHTGSLDPLASGMLPICFGEATKFSQYLLEANKRYLVTAKLGIKTTTGDTEGEIIAEKKVIGLTALDSILQKFCGEIEQIPSMFSAIKHQGQPLYRLARKGLTVERNPRKVFIYELKLIEQTADTLTLEIACSKGTYVRTLVEDIGEELGCGAHVIQLRRVEAGVYQESEMRTMPQLEQIASQGEMKFLDALLLPIDSALRNWPEVKISEAGAYYLKRGQPLINPQAPKEGFVRLYLNGDRFLGIGEILHDGRIAPKRLITKS